MFRFSSCFSKLLTALVVVLVCVSAGLARSHRTSSSTRPAHHVTSTGKATSRSTSGRKSSTSKASSRSYASASAREASTREASTRTVSKRGRGGKGRSRVVRTAPAAPARPRGQQSIENERAREIQEALIREKYMDGEPSGVWDQRTKDALTRFQGDHGWQTKIVPDSRALIKLGLGPNHEDVINPATSGLSAAPPVASSPTAERLQPGGSMANQ